MRVLFLGELPETADFDDPAVPPGLTPERIRAGIDQGMADMRGRGWDAVECMVPPEADRAVAQVREALRSGAAFDCVVLGGGLRMPASRVELFETLVNLLRVEAPDTALAFNTGPETTADAAARQLRT
jgi:hypothetical protein